MSDNLPAVALGVQYKMTEADADFLSSMGADDSGVDFYLAATKVLSQALS